MKVTPQAISTAVNYSFEKFAHFRRARGKFLSQFAGRFYSATKLRDREDSKASPLNLLHMAATTIVPNLVSADPRFTSKSEIVTHREYADMLRLGLDNLVVRIGLRHDLRKIIYDSIFMAGFVKTGLAGSDVITIDGTDIVVGQPYAERVDPDDMVLDPMARDWDEQDFIGSRIRVKADDLEGAGFDMDKVRALTRRYETQGGIAELLTGTGVERKYSDVMEYLDLVEIYLPHEQKIVTLPYSKDAVQDEFLHVADYAGPDTGPYHMLGYTPVGDNLMPVAPAQIWYDLHILGNRIARKLARQAERLKRVLAFEPSAQEDVEKIADADDGETVGVSDINKLKEITFGGGAPESYQWMDWVKRNFSEQAGSIELLSGISTNAPTATQAEMLQANTSVRLTDMQTIVYDFTSAIGRDLAFFLHTDPLIDIPLARRRTIINPTTGMSESRDIQVRYTPEMRQGSWFDFVIKVKPYSMGRTDPNLSVRRKLEFATNVIPAAAQAAATLGPGFKIGVFLRDIAKEVGIEEADEWLDDPAFVQWMQMKLQAAQSVGDPGKAGGGNSPMAGQGVPAFNPMQPNPSAMGPTGGISPTTEMASAQQDIAAELQGGNEPSARAMALAR